MRRQERDIQVYQNSVSKADNTSSRKVPFFAEVKDVFSDRMTCHVRTIDGYDLFNVPVLINGGEIDGAPYGERCLPTIGDWVLVTFGGKFERQEVIIGTIVPYLTNEFQEDAVNSSSKQFTKKLIEAGKELHDVRIFKSGTTWEVQEDGTVILEVPSGTYVRIDEANGKVEVVDQHGNTIVLDSTGTKIEDANGNDITMGVASVTINGNLEVLQ